MDTGEGAKASALLRRLRERLAGEQPSLGEVLAHLGDRAPGFILLALAIPAIVPTPGVPAGMVFGTVLGVVALQMIVGRDQLGVPGWLSRRRVRRRTVETVIEKATPLVERVETRLRARYPSMTHAPVLRPLGVFVLFMGVLIALPIPFGNTLPGLAVLVIALGLIAGDGLAVVAGLGLGAAATGVSLALVAGTYRALGSVSI